MTPILMSGLQWQECNFRRHTAGFASGDCPKTAQRVTPPMSYNESAGLIGRRFEPRGVTSGLTSTSDVRSRHRDCREGRFRTCAPQQRWTSGGLRVDGNRGYYSAWQTSAVQLLRD